MKTAEILTGLGLILGVLVAYVQIQRNQRAALQLQETHLKNELKLKLYERFSAVLDTTSHDISAVSVQYYSVISTFGLRVRNGLPVAPQQTGLELSERFHAAERGVPHVLNFLESYEVVFARFRAFRRHLSGDHSRLLEAHQALWTKILMYLPFIHAETGQRVGPLLVPPEAELMEMERLHAVYLDACGEVSSHLIDLQIEAQNELLGALFQRQLPPRHPADANLVVIGRDDSELEQRPRGSLV